MSESVSEPPAGGASSDVERAGGDVERPEAAVNDTELGVPSGDPGATDARAMPLVDDPSGRGNESVEGTV